MRARILLTALRVATVTTDRRSWRDARPFAEQGLMLPGGELQRRWGPR